MKEKSISFSLSEEQNMMKETINKLVKNNITDNAREIDGKGDIPREFIQKYWELGTILSSIPEEYGGYGMEYSPVLNCIILEELAFGDMAFAVAAHLPSLFMTPIMEMGTEDQKKKYIPLYCNEQYKPGSLAIMEPHFKYDPVSLQTSAEKKNGSYLLNGKKCFVPYADESEHIIIAASLNGGNDLFIVSRDNSGIKISAQEKNLGLYSLKTYEVELKNCEIPAEDRIGGEAGCDYNKFLQKSRTAVSAIGTGVSRASYEYAREYSLERVQFGEPVAHKQSVAFIIAEMAYEVDAMRLMTWKAATILETGEDASRESYLAKLYAGDMAMKITDHGVQVLGGHGYVREHPVERYYRNGRGIAILEGIAVV